MFGSADTLARSLPFSAGTALPGTHLPQWACDCHMHVYNARVPATPGAKLHPPDASFDDYRRVQARMGTSRTVVVTPSTYGADNRLTLRAVAQARGRARGVAVITGNEPGSTLAEWHAQGVCGVRVNLSLGTLHGPDDIERLARRIAPFGWHLQLLMPLDQLAALGPRLHALPTDLVFDHFGRVTPQDAESHPAHALLLSLLQARRAWVKLSGGYLVSPRGRSDDPTLRPLARSFIEAAPDRVLWGSDWPHATASAGHQAMPDDAAQVDALADWAGDADTLRQITVTNPERLYGFPPSTSP